MEATTIPGVAGVDVSCLGLIMVVSCVLWTFEYDKRIPPFAARKLTHLCMGTLVLVLMLSETYRASRNIRMVLGSFAVFAIVLCFVRPFRFGRYRDKGIIIFNVLVLIFLIYDLDFGYMAPAFLADPMGAVVGRSVRTAKWIGKKTVGGTAAVFVVCFFASFRVKSVINRLGLAAGCAILEAVGGEFDNLVMNIPLFVYYAAESYARSKGIAEF